MHLGLTNDESQLAKLWVPKADQLLINCDLSETNGSEMQDADLDASLLVWTKNLQFAFPYF